MKRYISLILTWLLIGAAMNAQDPETLTNSSVIKMSKAKLADELITDMIQNSPVKFDLSPGAIRNLEDEGVSAAVIQAMKAAPDSEAETRMSSSAAEKQVTAPPPRQGYITYGSSVFEPSKVLSTVSLEALNYTAPLTELIKYNEKKINGLETTLAEWDKKVRGYIADINRVKDQMTQVENELRIIKNTDTKAFGGEVTTLKGRLAAYRKNYRQTKDIMIKGGAAIVKNLETMSSDAIRELGKAYSEASQQVGSANTNPSAGEKPVAASYNVMEGNSSCVSYIAYLNEMTVWHQNEIRLLHGLINEWNPRVTSKLIEDAKLKSQMEPIENKIQELGVNQKQNRNEISSLKKQLSEIEKARKKLADQMKDDAKELASSLKQLSQENQKSLEVRFADIIENIAYSFSEKLSM